VSIGPAQIAAARTAVTITGALTRAIGAAAGEVVASAKPTFEQIFAGKAGQAEPTKPEVAPPSIVDQLTDTIKNLLSGARVELSSPVSFAVSADGTLSVDGNHPQHELIETAIAHDKSIEQLIGQWIATNDQSGRREPLGFSVAPTFGSPTVR